MIVSVDQKFLTEGEMGAANELPTSAPNIALWTDDYCSIFELLRR
jgi:hypothetical protein